MPLGSPLVAELGKRSWRVGDDPLRARWLRLAACHSTYLYEFDRPPISVAALALLGKVGATHLALAGADLVVERTRPDKVGKQNHLVAHMPGCIAKQVADSLAVAESMNLGRGEEPNRRTTSRLAEDVMHQALGVVVLLGGYTTVRRLVTEVYEQALQQVLTEGIDWWGELARLVPVQQLRIRDDEEGPDHDRTFTREIVDNRGRRGRGDSPKRTGARHLAAQDYLRNVGLYGEVVARLGDRSISRLTEAPRRFASADGLQERTITELAATLRLAAEHKAYLQQALTHKSWTYENQPLVRQARQRDYELLANHGSFVVRAVSAAEFTRDLLRRTLKPEPEDGAIHSLPERCYVDMFDRLVAESAVLRGRGEAECKPRMKAEAFQAIVAVAWRFGEAGLPETLRGWILRETRARELDELSRLQRLCTAFGGEISPSYTSAGPAHDSRFTATLTLRIGEIEIVRTGPPTPGRKEATRLAAEQLYQLFTLRSDFPASGGTAAEREESMLLLRHLARRLSMLRGRDLRRCVEDGVLGLGLLAASDGSLRDFLNWAKEVDSLVGPMDDEVFNDLVAAYGSVVKARSRPRLEDALRDLAAWVRNLDPEGNVVVRGAPQWELLLAVAGALRAGAAREQKTVNQLSGSWPVQGPESTSLLSAVDAAAISELLREFSNASVGTVDFRRASDGVQLECVTTAPDAAHRVRTLVGLLAETAPGLEVVAGPDTHTISAAYSPGPADRSFAAAGSLADGCQDQDGIEILANVLHRLKNELIGMEDVAQKAALATERVTRFHRLADAARHHEAALQLANHLDRTNRALADADEETVELGRWLDEYCAAKVLELRDRANVRLIAPANSGQCEVAFSASLLRGVLDNLVKNAVEAMPNGGQIIVDWYTEPGHVFLIVHDDGPGLPAEIRETFWRDETVTTTKEHGSGMGLWLVRMDLRRLGATISDDPAAHGQRWVIDLPREEVIGGLPERRSATSPQVRAASRRTVRVLLVDDQENVARTMAGHLESIARVEIAHDGESALTRLSTEHYDIVVTDLQMPPEPWGGLWLLGRMKDEGRRVPVVVLSGEGSFDQAIDALNAGAFKYVTKADAAEKLAAVVEEVLSHLRRHSRSDLQHLPLPVALGLQRYESEMVANLRVRAGHAALEDALRFISAVGIGELVGGHPDARVPRPALASQMMLGKRVELLKVLESRLAQDSYAGQVIRSLDLDALAVVKTGRNVVSHNSERPNDEVTRMLDEVDPLLEQFATALRHIPDRTVMIAQGLRFDAKRYRVTAFHVTGTGPVLPSTEITSDIPLAENSVGLYNPSTGSWVPVGPWMTARPGDTRGEWQISVVEGVNLRTTLPAKLAYQPFGGGTKWAAEADESANELIRRSVAR
ncbi:response regulator [Micromonospora sp. B006]|uniref:response regulator n=1 Tax=Micromonospora sp. B006 TaxID=2201999 RepID=UPI001375DFE1|nr:response regulator [Micromonospora sp. B006]